ncbi:MAG: helix-turn-helix domain-containing protein [Oscillospiraceae bacterium]|nr:helix-turn-helix domain-containing protein [Oscillospiraceae bacterium]
MAKGKYEKWETEEGFILLQGWARDGLSNEQIAQNMGIAAATLYSWREGHPEILEAIKKGKEVADYEMENALYEKGIRGDVAAQIFWLTNRRPEKWQNRQRMDAKAVIEAQASLAVRSDPYEELTSDELRGLLAQEPPSG